MQLPNYFLADLPPEHPLATGLVTEACQTLKRNRERFLLPRSTDAIIQALVEVGRLWTAPHSPWMALALEQGPAATGFSRELLADGLQRYFRRWTPRALQNLVLQEFAHPQRLDRLVANDAEHIAAISARVRGPELLLHITAGILPTPVFTAILHGLLVRSAQFVKCASRSSLLPRLFAHSLRELEPKLAACLEIAEWPGGRGLPAESELLQEIDCAVASGSDETIEAIRHALPSRVRFLAHGHRVSAGYIARESLNPAELPATLESAARDVAAWDQLGCLSPQVLYVETGGLIPPEDFAAELAGALDRLEQRLPRGPLDPATSAAIAQRRDYYRIRAASGDHTRCWSSKDSTAWTVIYEADARFQPSCLHRFILVKAVDTLEECLHQAEMIRGQWSTVGLAANGVRIEELARSFADWGITRICPLGTMQDPPLTWRHDGRPVLGDLVTWTTHERPLDP
ncbi:MAG: hypothetical protein KF833_05165 [Verrucomicrobiae bacterium]|nr:hypothetical protein [Verrucomicrobiae bacterium]